jgi:glucose/arabinose dehydrogenase
MKRRWLTLAVALSLAGLAAAAIYLYRGYLVPVLPSLASEKTSLEALKLPPGFRIQVYADDIPGARSLALSPSGTLFVGTRGEGKVYAVMDRDGNFKADRIHTLASGLQMPNGVAFRDGDLYVAEVSRVLRFPAIENNLASPPAPTVIVSDYPRDRHHGWKFIAFGPDGRLYVPVGAPCNVCMPDEETFAVITRLDVASGKRQVFAKGVRNTVGFDWSPRTGELWFTDNGRDWLGENRRTSSTAHPRRGCISAFPSATGATCPIPSSVACATAAN